MIQYDPTSTTEIRIASLRRLNEWASDAIYNKTDDHTHSVSFMLYGKGQINSRHPMYFPRSEHTPNIGTGGDSENHFVGRIYYFNCARTQWCVGAGARNPLMILMWDLGGGSKRGVPHGSQEKSSMQEPNRMSRSSRSMIPDHVWSTPPPRSSRVLMSRNSLTAIRINGISSKNSPFVFDCLETRGFC